MNLTRIFFATFISMIGLAAQGQIYTFYDYNLNRSLVEYVNRDIDLVKENGISSRTMEVNEYDKHGKLSSTWVSSRFFYNEAGQIIRDEYYNALGNLRRATNYSFNEKGQVIGKEIFHRRKEQASSKWTISYFNDTLISTVHTYTKKGKHSWGYRYSYNEKNQIIEQRRYKKNKLAGRVEYDYYGDLSKKEVRYYDDSLDLEKTYRYDCGIGNSLLTQKQKDTLTRCSRSEELADGTKRFIEETRDEKGRIIRTIYDTNLKEQWYETRSYDRKNRLKYTYRREVIEKDKTKVIYQNYKRGKAKKGHLNYTWKDQFGFDYFETYDKDLLERQYYSSYTFFKK